jgi:hypothetical protein
VLALYAAHAARLIAFPWDWTPDEGLDLDYAQRLLRAPGSLWRADSVVPFPCAYGPVLPALLLPVAWLAPQSLGAARVVAFAWTACGALAAYLLARREAPPSLALAGAALSLAAVDVTYWSMHVRVDGLLLALWMLAALALLPRALQRGADSLGWRRIAGGSALLLAATLAKPTAALHGLPLVLAWLLVDVRGAVRLALALGGAGFAALGALHWATSGGYLAVARLWTMHPALPGQGRTLAAFYLSRTWPLLVPAALALAVSRGRARLLRDGSLVLVAGAVAAVPLMNKSGASWNYLVLVPPALAVLGARWWAIGVHDGRAPRVAGAVLTAAIALLLSLTRVFPLPTDEDERTARAFYGLVGSVARQAGAPLLASRPTYAYVVVGQPVEIEGVSFPQLVRAGAPGVGRVLDRLQRAEYSAVVMSWEMPDEPAYWEALERSYVHAGGCDLAHSLGMQHAHVFIRRDVYRYRHPPPGVRCGPSIRLPKARPAGSGAAAP